MDLFDEPRKVKKVPSPIKHLLPSDAKETDDLPKPTWGLENAPPIVGAVHKRPREANVSPCLLFTPRQFCFQKFGDFVPIAQQLSCNNVMRVNSSIKTSSSLALSRTEESISAGPHFLFVIFL